MKKLIVILGFLIAAAGAGIYFLLPTNINWEKYVQEISAQVQVRTGLSLAIQGTPSFSMKPTPILKLGQIRLGNVKDGAYPQMMTASRAEFLFDTASLFRRKIKIKKITLYSPQFYFETEASGKWNWQIAFFDKAGMNGTIGFDSLMLSDGSAEIKADKYAPVQKWSRLNAELFADSIQGPFFFEGNFGAASSNFNFSLKVEQYLNGQSPDFSLRLINAPAEASFVLTGKYGLSEADRGILTGQMSFDVRKPDRFFALLYPQEKLPQAVFQPVVGNMKINKSAQTRTTDLTDILFQYGTSSATGNLSIRSLSPQEASSLQAQKEALADDDEIILRDPANPSEEIRLDGAPVSQTTLAQNLLPKVVTGSFVFSKLDADPFFDNMSALVDFLAKRKIFVKTQDSYALKVMFDVVNYKKDAIHQLGGHVKSVSDGLAFEGISATLPSNAYVSGNAALNLTKKPLLTGKMNIETDNINSLLGWLQIPVPEEVPQSLLHPFKAETEFKLAENGLVLKQLKGNLDKIDFSGDFAFRNGKRKAVSFSGIFSELDFSQYFPVISKNFIQEREGFARQSSVEKVKTLFRKLAFFNDCDLNIKIKSDSLSWADINAKNINADFSVVRGQMKIDRLSADKLFASSVFIQGETDGFGTEPKFNDFKINIDAQQLSTLVQSVGVVLPRNIAPQDKMKLSARLTGTLQAMSFDGSVDFGSSRFSGQGDFKEAGNDLFDWNAEFDIYHENFRNFVRLFSDAYRPVLANPGALNFKGRVLKNKDFFQLSDMRVQIGDNETTGSVKVRYQGEKPVISAEITGGNLAPLGMLPRVNFADSISVDAEKKIPENFWENNGGLTRFADGLSFSQKTFDFSFLGKYEASIALKAKNLFLNSFVLSNFDGIVKLFEDKVVLDLRRSLWNGSNLGGIINLMPVSGVLTVRGAVRLSNVDIPAGLFDSGTLNLSGIENMIVNLNVNGSGQSADALVSSLTGTGTLSFEKADLDGIDMSKLTQMLSTEQSLEKESIQKEALTGRTVLSKFSGTVGLKEGVFDIKPASFLYNGAKNASPFFSYNYLTRTLFAGVSFPIDIQSVPAVSLTVNKKAEQPAVLAQNIGDVVSKRVMLDKERKEQVVLAQKQLEREKEEKEEKERLKKLERLNGLEKQVTMALTELVKKRKNVEKNSSKFYQLHKYRMILIRANDALSSLNEEIRETGKNIQKKTNVSEADIAALEQKLKENYLDKRKDIDEAYNTILIVGTKERIFDILKQAEEKLRLENKDRAIYSGLSGGDENINQIKAELKKLQNIEKEIKAEGISYDDLMEFLGKAEAGFEKINALRQKTLAEVEREKKKIAAEENAKREAEEQKKIEKEKAKKAAEEAAMAEKARLEAEEKKQKRAIIRKDGIRTETISSSVKEKSTSATLKPEQEKADENQKETKKNNPIVIRRR